MQPLPEREPAQAQRVAKQVRELVEAERTLRSAVGRALVAELAPELEPAVWPVLARKLASEPELVLRERPVLDALRQAVELHLLALVARLVAVRVCSLVQGQPQERERQQRSACVPTA